jgi:hypothetical protein
LRIKGCSRLPATYRSVPRPSSPLSAKASVRSPYALDRSQQNPCAGKKPPREAPGGNTSPSAGLRINCQTMFFIKSALKALEKPDKPFIHNVIPAGRSRWETCFPAIALDALNWGSSCCAWWSQTGSNRRPHACKARALPTELWPLSASAQARRACHQDPFARSKPPGFT